MKIKLLLLCCLFWVAGTAQNLVSISPFTMPSNVPANTADWGSLSALFVLATANGTPLPIALENAQVAFTIKKGGSKICGGTLQAAQFTARTKYYKANDISGMLGGCILRPGTYQLCVQFFANLNGSASALVPISAEKCSSNEFVIENTTSTQTDTKYTAPQNITPTDKKEFTDKEIKAPITFRWTPCLPKPQGPVNYRLKVWQLKQGQNGTTAMRSNTPIVEKDVNNITQAVITNLNAEPCMLPRICAFVWNVEAIDAQGKVLGSSEPTGFSIKAIEKTDNPKGNPNTNKVMGGSVADFKIDSATCLKKENGLFKYHIWAHYENVTGSASNILLNDNLPFAGYPANPNPGTGLNLRNNIRLKSGIYNGALTMADIVESSSGTISNISPIPASIFTPAFLIPNSIHNFQFDFSTATNTPVQFTYYGLVDDALKGQPNRNTRNEIDSLKYPKCPCSACDEITTAAPLDQGGFTNTGNGIINFSTTLSSSPKKVKRIRTELVYFEFKPESENCVSCNKNSTFFGNFSSATTNNTNFTPTLPYSGSAQFDALNSVDISGGIKMNFGITIPPLVGCCSATVKFCIRYVITFDDCTVCNKLECYTYEIQGCQKTK